VAVEWAQALRDLAGRLGLGVLRPDDDGTYTLLIGEQKPIYLQIAEQGDEVLLFAPLGTLPAAQAGEASISLLQANHFWVETGGFTLSMIPGTLNVTLVARRAIAETEAGSQLYDLLDRFVGSASLWRARVGELAAGRPLLAA
jgi:hypothetical protein